MLTFVVLLFCGLKTKNYLRRLLFAVWIWNFWLIRIHVGDLQSVCILQKTQLHFFKNSIFQLFVFSFFIESMLNSSHLIFISYTWVSSLSTLAETLWVVHSTNMFESVKIKMVSPVNKEDRYFAWKMIWMFKKLYMVELKFITHDSHPRRMQFQRKCKVKKLCFLFYFI